MKTSNLILILIAIGVMGAGGYSAYWLGMSRGMQMATPAPGAAANSGSGTQKAGEVDPAIGKKVLYWYDPMFPQQKFDKPGKSPFMDMQLVPKYADEADTGTVTISPRVVQNLGVRMAEVKVGALEQRFDTVGTVAFDERGVVQLQARAAGFIEKLHARAPLDPVTKGAPLVEMLFPEWAGAQEEFLLLKKNNSPDVQPLVQAARQRLALLGMSEEEIAAIEHEGRVRQRFTRYAPISGVIAELGVREGMAVMPGHTLFRIVDLSTVWVNAEIPATQAAGVLPGRGLVTQLDPQGRIELEHEAIASLQWPAMRMGFVVEDKAQLAGLKPGDPVEFELRAAPDKDGNYVIQRIARGGGQ